MPFTRITSNLLLFCFLFCVQLQAQVISTFAGNGSVGSSGNGGTASSAQLNGPQGICVDNANNIYIADYFNYVIRKVNTAGIITIFAGTGTMGFSGDGGSATAADVGLPLGICIDKAGNIYFSDAKFHVVRKINTAGIISTIAGTPSISGYTGDGGLATNATMATPSGMCADNAGNIYVAEFSNQVIRKISITGIITTVAGIGMLGYFGDGGSAVNALLASPTDVKIDNAGNLYIADVGNIVIRKVNAAGIISTFAGGAGIGYTGDGGSATSASLKYAYGIYADANGNVYISDTGNGVVRVVNGSGIITTIAGNGNIGYSGDNGLPTNATLSSPSGICIDGNGNIYISDGGANVIRKISSCSLAVIQTAPVNQTVCENANTMFFVKAADATGYQWQVNEGSGWMPVNDNATYNGATHDTLSITNLLIAMNNYRYRCLVSNACGNIPSPETLLTVSSASNPTLQIISSADTICSGMNVIFTATSINAGIAPAYQWKKNGMNVSTNSTSYSANDLQNNDSISCVLTSSNQCTVNIYAVSNKINIVVRPLVSPFINITASGNNICAGTAITFTATITNGGNKPMFQWKKNGMPSGIDSSAYIDDTLADGDTITCELVSSESCTTVNPVTSNAIVIKVNPLLTPAISITTTAAAVCLGGTASFTATATNDGFSPVYEWKRNGAIVGTNSNTYTGSFQDTNTLISCKILSNAACLVTDSATSNTIKINLFKTPVVSLDTSTTLCIGSSRQLDAGIFNTYVWNNGTGNRLLTINSTGIYFVTVTDINGCTGSDTVTVSTLLPNPSGFLPADTSICTYETVIIQPKAMYVSYLWNNGSVNESISINKPGTYTLQVRDHNTCTSKDTIIVSAKQCSSGFYIPTAFSPNNDGKNDFFKPTIFGNLKSYRFIVYNRWGQVIFETTDIQKGWDGTLKGGVQNSNGYVWKCSYFIEGVRLENKQGNVVLLR